MYFIKEKNEFSDIKKIACQLVDIRKKIPEDPFVMQSLKNNMIFLDPYSFDFRRPYLFRMIQSLLKSTHSSECIVMVIDDPSHQYHFDAFNTFPAFIFSTDDNEQDIDSALNKQLGSEKDFSLMLGITQRFVIFPKDSKWVIVADRNFDIAIAAFHEQKYMELFQQADEDVCYEDFNTTLDFLASTGKKTEQLKLFTENFSPTLTY